MKKTLMTTLFSNYTSLLKLVSSSSESTICLLLVCFYVCFGFYEMDETTKKLTVGVGGESCLGKIHFSKMLFLTVYPIRESWGNLEAFQLEMVTVFMNRAYTDFFPFTVSFSQFCLFYFVLFAMPSNSPFSVVGLPFLQSTWATIQELKPAFKF